jgi:hypothetical protein
MVKSDNILSDLGCHTFFFRVLRSFIMLGFIGGGP